MSALLTFIQENHILALIENAKHKKSSCLLLNNYNITSVPLLLFTCKDLKNLFLSRNSIKSLPPNIKSITNLTNLTLDYNNLISLPKEIVFLKSLTYLNISSNPFKFFPSEICLLANLEELWCNSIDISELPADIGKLVRLDTFGARKNHISVLPDEMKHMTNLAWLTLEDNNIQVLPDWLNSLKSLTHCNLKRNLVRVLPRNIQLCPVIMFLQLNHNLIERLPEDFNTSEMKSLVMIDLQNNPISFNTNNFKHPQIRYNEEWPIECETEPLGVSASEQTTIFSTSSLAITATQIQVNTAGNNQHIQPPLVEDIEAEVISLSSSSTVSSDWENSVATQQLNDDLHIDIERIDNGAFGMRLPELSRFASTGI